MGRRSLRLRRAQLTPEGLRDWLGREVDAVLADGSTRHGRLVAVDQAGLVLEDNLHGLEWRNSRHRHRLAYTQLVELLVAPFSPL